LETCDEQARVWIWQNGSDPETLEVVRSLSSHPRVHRFDHSPTNEMLRTPTNWFWENATGDFLCKVDDDCLVPHGWLQTLRRAHDDEQSFGILSCWPFLQEDFIPSVGGRKIERFGGGHEVMRNAWVGGGGYMMKRACREQMGLLGPDESFPRYCLRAALKGWIHGYHYPLLVMAHFDDPRSPHCRFKSEEDFQRYRSLSARRFGTSSLSEAHTRARQAAVEVQKAAVDPRSHCGWRGRINRIVKRLVRSGGGRRALFNP
jgi:GT2 family glycosyltransferase